MEPPVGDDDDAKGVRETLLDVSPQAVSEEETKQCERVKYVLSGVFLSCVLMGVLFFVFIRKAWWEECERLALEEAIRTRAEVDSPAPLAVTDPWEGWSHKSEDGAKCRSSPDRVVLTLYLTPENAWPTLEYMQGHGSSFNSTIDVTNEESDPVRALEYHRRKMLVWFWLNYWKSETLRYRCVFVYNPGALSDAIVKELTTDCVTFYQYDPKGLPGDAPNVYIDDRRDLYTMRIPYIRQYSKWAPEHEASLGGKPIRFLVHIDLDGVCFRDPSVSFERWPSQIDVVVSRVIDPWMFTSEFPVGYTKGLYKEMQRQLRRCVIDDLPREIGGGQANSQRWNAETLGYDLHSVPFSGKGYVLHSVLEQMETASQYMQSGAICDMALVTYGFNHMGYGSHGRHSTRAAGQFMFTPIPLVSANVTRWPPVRTIHTWRAPITCPFNPSSAQCEVAPLAPLCNGKSKADLDQVEFEFPCGHAHGVPLTVTSCFRKLSEFGPSRLQHTYYTAGMILLCK